MNEIIYACVYHYLYIFTGMSRSMSIMSEDASLFTDTKTSQEAISAFQIYDSSSLNTQPTSDKQSLYSIQVQPIFSSGELASSSHQYFHL